MKILVEKMISPIILDTDHAFKRQNTIFLTKKIVYQSFYDALLMFSFFSSRKISVFLACIDKLLAKCSLSEDPC